MKRYDLTWGTLSLLTLVLSFFGIFLLYPAGLMLKEAFVVEGHITLHQFQLLLESPLQRDALWNSFILASGATLGATFVALPLAWITTRYQFAGRSALSALLLLPLILPPFVGAVGLKQLLARFGSVNLTLMKLGLIREDHPIDWLGVGGFWGILILQVANLYPILFLNLSAALANVDPSLREAAQNLGASGWKLFRTITLPLILPGYFAGAIIVFIGAFTDLGTPIIFGYSRLVPVQIFDAVNEINSNPIGYTLVAFVLLLTVLLFTLSKGWIAGKRYEMIGRGHVAAAEQQASRRQTLLIWLLAGTWLSISVLPHLAVLGQSFSEHWFLSILPDQWTSEHYRALWSHGLTASSIQNSLIYSSFSAGIDLVLGVAIAWLLTRRRIPGGPWLDALSMIPLALPGLVLAFGYVAAFDFKTPWLNPRLNPVFLLTISYSVRRLPYLVRSAYAGFQQTSITLEEASANLGASPWYTLRRITLPLVAAHLVAGAILTFAFAMLEVSDGLILAMKDHYFPITKTIYILMGRIDPTAPSIASALGVVGMGILTVSLLIAGKLLGKSLGQLFRA